MNKEQTINFINSIKKEDIVIHLSHNDLDGYGSTYIVEQYLKGRCHLIQDNTNYGKIISKLEELNISKTIKVIITDLNLTLDECKLLNTLCDSWMVIDHHITGQDSFQEYPENYYLDVSKCATKSVFELLNVSEIHIDHVLELRNLTDIINTYDLWKKEDIIMFKKGMLLSYYVYNNPFESKSLRHKYNSWMFSEIGKFLIEYGVQETEMQYQRMFLFWLQNLGDYDFLRDIELPSNIKVALMHIDVLKNHIVHITDEYIVFTGISTKVTQYAFDELFKSDEYKDKVLINMSVKGYRVNCSFRDIVGNSSKFAIRAGGGGHKFASGASFKIAENDIALEALVNKLNKED